MRERYKVIKGVSKGSRGQGFGISLAWGLREGFWLNCGCCHMASIPFFPIKCPLIFTLIRHVLFNDNKKAREKSKYKTKKRAFKKQVHPQILSWGNKLSKYPQMLAGESRILRWENKLTTESWLPDSSFATISACQFSSFSMTKGKLCGEIVTRSLIGDLLMGNFCWSWRITSSAYSLYIIS